MKIVQLSDQNLASEDDYSDDLPFQITDIKPAVKNSHRVNIFINGKYDFSLDLTQLVDFKLKIGRRLSTTKLTEYQHASEFGKLYQRALEWALSRPHSIREARDYLFRKQLRRRSNNRLAEALLKKSATTEGKAAFRTLRDNGSGSSVNPLGGGREERVRKSLRTLSQPEISKEDQDAIIDRLVEKGFLNDRKFAEYFVENRFQKKGVSKKRLKLELMKKGVDVSIIEAVLAENSRDDATEIRKIIAKKRQHYTNDKLTSYLVRQGFDYSLAHSLVQQSSETDSQN